MEREAGKEDICVDQVSVTWRREVLKSLFYCATGGEGRGKRSRNVRRDKMGSKGRRELEEKETKSPRMHR